jgi:YVTN family beta-propeller protein
MMNPFRPLIFSICALVSASLIESCSSTKSYKTSVDIRGSYHSVYDNKTIAADSNSILMPYNRFIDPAGTVIRFGTPTTENHSLDCIMLPDEKVLAVEDRFGLALIDVHEKKLLYHLDYTGNYKGLRSTFSGVKFWHDGKDIHIYWGASNPTTRTSVIVDAIWDGKKATIVDAISFPAVEPAPMALPNDIVVSGEGNEFYLYVVLNGNNQVVKVRLKDRKIIWTAATAMAPYGIAYYKSKIYVTNWAGRTAQQSAQGAGIPYGDVQVDPRTGATSSGTVSVFDAQFGKMESEVEVGLHPSAIIPSHEGKFLYVSNGNSDNVSVINASTNTVVETISVKLNKAAGYIGDSPNALALDRAGTTLYVSNGMDNAIAVVKLGAQASATGSGTSTISGFIPTEAYPAGLVINNGVVYVCNLEGEGARVVSKKGFNCHEQEATVSIISVPDDKTLQAYSKRVESANMLFRTKLTQLVPRENVAPKPIPDRIGEPSVFKHVVYIIKENKTYDQVLGDMTEGNGMKSLCVFGNDVTPNAHKIAKDYLLLDNFYASGKSSAEGHSWTDAGIVTDYVEKNVYAWFRSYPHVLADAMVYNKEGFIWNNALDHGKTVRIYGEACSPKFKSGLGWQDIYKMYQQQQPLEFTNSTTISRVDPIMSQNYPCFESQKINDQIRADAFIKELKEYESLPGDQLPQLMILALPADHTAGMREGFPTPRAMVADNDLAFGRIIEALTQSRFWDSTVVFVTQDDPQSGWDHVSSYRTTGFVISPYSKLSKTIHTNYNQTCILRTIEQILGIPPMNVIDATALPMFDCFSNVPDRSAYVSLKNNIPLDEMNKSATTLSGKAKKFSRLSSLPEFDHIDGGNDDLLNRIIWFAMNGKKKYPRKMTLSKEEQEDDDD